MVQCMRADAVLCCTIPTVAVWRQGLPVGAPRVWPVSAAHASLHDLVALRAKLRHAAGDAHVATRKEMACSDHSSRRLPLCLPIHLSQLDRPPPSFREHHHIHICPRRVVVGGCRRSAAPAPPPPDAGEVTKATWMTNLLPLMRRMNRWILPSCGDIRSSSRPGSSRRRGEQINHTHTHTHMYICIY